MPSTSLEDLIGAKLVIGFPGTRVTPEIIQHFKDLRIGGVIFYRINFESPAQLKQVISDLENALQRRLLVCVDHEGGRVIMYRDGVTIFPDNLAVGHTRNAAHAKDMGRIAARELRALGTDVNFAPVLDVLTPSYSPNIGIRSFGQDWKLVMDLGVAYIEGLQEGNVSATAKHFPGKGHAQVDAHLKLPTINSTWDEMKQIHVQPFLKAIASGVDVIMSSHPFYPRLDPNPQNIATFSRRIMTDYLRGELGYKGVLASDDLEMGAITETCPIDTAAVRTVAAGHDLILSCHDLNAERKVFNGLLDAYRAKFLPLSELEESVDRIEKLKAKRPKRFEGDFGPDPKGPPLAARIAKEGLKVVQDKNNRLPIPKANRNDIAVIFPQLSSFAPKIMIERPFENEPAYFKEALERRGASAGVTVYGISTTDIEISKAAAAAGKAKTTILFLFDAHLHPEQKKLLNSVQLATNNLIVGLLRDPYDDEFLRPTDTCLTAFGFRQCQVEAILDRIFGF